MVYLESTFLRKVGFAEKAKESGDLFCSDTSMVFGSWLLLAEQPAFLPNQKKKR